MTDDLEALKVTASIDKTTSMLRRYNITKGRGGYPQSLELYAVQNVLDALTAALAEVKRLRDALQPFAAAADEWNDPPGLIRYDDSLQLWQARQTKVCVGDLRGARAALTQQSQAGGGDDVQS